MLSNPPNNKVAVVTGAGRGIGRACALALAEKGHPVALISRTLRELESVAALIDEKGGRSLVCCGDVSSEAFVVDAFRQIRQGLGEVAILINNAAIFFKSTFADHGAPEWDQVMAVNVRGSFLCSREVFRAGQSASIVNVSSLAGIRGTEKFLGFSSYIASKHAVVGLTEALALEGKALRIRVNCIAPGAVDTDMLHRAAPGLQTQTTPEQIAKSILILADDDHSSHLTGSILEVFSNA